MTEEEAKEKVCPNKVHLYGGDGTNCIGSVCMAWREHSELLEDDTGKEWYTTDGYCGLAGKVYD